MNRNPFIDKMLQSEYCKRRVYDVYRNHPGVCKVLQKACGNTMMRRGLSTFEDDLTGEVWVLDLSPLTHPDVGEPIKIPTDVTEVFNGGQHDEKQRLHLLTHAVGRLS